MSRQERLGASVRPPSRVGLVILVVALGLLIVAHRRRLPTTPPIAPAVTIRVDDRGAGGSPLTLQVGTNQIYGVVQFNSPAPSAQRRLDDLAPSLVRLHVLFPANNLPTAARTVRLCPTPTDTRCNRVPWSFTNLDYLVGEVKAAHAEPLMNIAVPPAWQWTVTDPTSQPKATAYVTDADDPRHPFAQFAGYMRSLVEYYNRGRTTVTEADGRRRTIVNPYGRRNRVTWWELVNEPNITSPANPYQPVGPYPLTPTFTPHEYSAMWTATTAQMLRADPTIKFVGPTLAYVSAAPEQSYIPLLLRQPRRPDALSIHAYAWVDNDITDREGYAGAASNPGRRGLSDIVTQLHLVQRWRADAHLPRLPIWIDEFGFNGFGVLDPHNRPTHGYGAAYTAAAFALLAHEPGVQQLDNFSFMLTGYPDLSLLDLSADRQPVLLYWVYRALGQAFPVGSTLLPLRSTAPTFTVSVPGLVRLAVRLPHSTSVAVLLANTAVAQTADRGGSGRTQTVHVALMGPRFTHARVQYLDDRTNLDRGPAPIAIPISRDRTVSVTLHGYAVAVVQLTR